MSTTDNPNPYKITSNLTSTILTSNTFSIIFYPLSRFGIIDRGSRSRSVRSRVVKLLIVINIIMLVVWRGGYKRGAGAGAPFVARYPRASARESWVKWHLTPKNGGQILRKCQMSRAVVLERTRIFLIGFRSVKVILLCERVIGGSRPHFYVYCCMGNFMCAIFCVSLRFEKMLSVL